MPIAFCPSDYCLVGARHDDGRTDTYDDAVSRRPELLRLVDFYASILAMGTHDLRQPLQVIVSVLELLARRVTEGPERAHLESGKQVPSSRKSWRN